ncbi:MAG: hypothetical protein Q7S08_04965 [bacterium]|nr:hypothetical protein [bacterium]
MEPSNAKSGKYVCSECGLTYKEDEWMKKCEAWCKKYKSCNLEIISHAVEN